MTDGFEQESGNGHKRLWTGAFWVVCALFRSTDDSDERFGTADDSWLHLESRMRSFFRIASPWCFLVLLAFSIAPRQLFHHCAAADEHVAHSSTTAYHADCPVCDVAIPVASAEGRIEANSVLDLFVVLIAPPQNTPFLVPAFRVPDRGPPSFC